MSMRKRTLSNYSGALHTSGNRERERLQDQKARIALAEETLTNVGEPFVEVHHHPNVVAMTLLLPLLLALWLRRLSWMKMEGQLYLNRPSHCNCLHNLGLEEDTAWLIEQTREVQLTHIEMAWLMKVGTSSTWIPFNSKSPTKFITIEASPSTSLTCQRQPRGSYDK